MSALPASTAPGGGDDYARFCAALFPLTGIDLNQYKPTQMERRIRSFAQRVGCDTLDAYVVYLRRDPDEVRSLLDRITINVSQLFRNPSQWEFIRTDLLRELTKGGKALRAWSAGCSYGAEAYSLAALALETVPDANVRVHASDIDREVLERAKRGEFSVDDAREAPERVLRRWFDRVGEEGRLTDGYRAKPELRDRINFARENLLEIAPRPGSFDLILCRNVVIYFTREAREQVHAMQARALRAGGYLIIGSTERIGQPLAELGLEQVRPFIYRRTP